MIYSINIFVMVTIADGGTDTDRAFECLKNTRMTRSQPVMPTAKVRSFSGILRVRIDAGIRLEPARMSRSVIDTLEVTEI